MGRIEVTVCEARKLFDCQLVGMPDPFVRITCEDKNYKTNVIKNTLEPKWNETFRFQIADEMSSQLVMEIWNKCVYSDDLMGRYQLSLGGLTRGVVKDDWYILDKSKTEAELRVRVLAVDFGKDPHPEQTWMVTTDINRDPVLRAIEDGKWSFGQKTGVPPAPSGPPTANAPVPGQLPYPTQLPQPTQQPPYPQGTATVTLSYGQQSQQQVYPPQAYSPQPGYPPQGYPPQPGYPPQGYPPQGAYPPQGYPPQPQGYPQPGYPPQGYPPQSGYPPQPGYPPQGYPPQSGYPPQPGYPPQGYPPQGGYPSQGYRPY